MMKNVMKLDETHASAQAMNGAFSSPFHYVFITFLSRSLDSRQLGWTSMAAGGITSGV